MCFFKKTPVVVVKPVIPDWKNKIDELEEHKRKENEQSKKEEELARKKGSEELDERNKRERLEKLAELGKNFRCHVCGKISQKPRQKYESSYVNLGYGASEFGEGSYFDDWTKPDDLFQCSICHEWTCEEHLHKGVCQECAEKL